MASSEARALTDEGEVVVAARGIGNGRSAIGRDAEVGQVGHRAAINGDRAAQVSPTPMALPALPPLLMSPMDTAPPLADAVATPPLPAEAMSVPLHLRQRTCPAGFALPLGCSQDSRRGPNRCCVHSAFHRLTPLFVHAGHSCVVPRCPARFPVDGLEDGSVPLWHPLHVSGRLSRANHRATHTAGQPPIPLHGPCQRTVLLV